MSDIAEYIDSEDLRRLQEAFSSVACRDVIICDAEGRPVLVPDRSGARPPLSRPCHRGQLPEGYAEPIVLENEVIGQLRLGKVDSDPPSDDQARPLAAIASLVGQVIQREQQLRFRIEELSTLYRLTAEFAGTRELKSVLDLAARTVVEVLGIKACAIRLLSEDGNKLIIEAVANLSPEYLDKGPVLASESEIDQQVLSTGETVYVDDLRTDPRVIYRDGARREGIVSALCAPLIYKGQPQGVIRAYTDRPYRFDWFEISLLRTIAAQAAAAIVSARLQEEAIQSAQMRRALDMAGVVQRRMIPPAPTDIPGFDIGAVYIPTQQLSGDFYDFIRLPEDNLAVTVCDVVGKGAPASLLMASIRASLRGHAMNVYEMSLVLDKVNRDLCADTMASDFATMFYAVLDIQGRKITYANAGHCPPLVYSRGRIDQLKGNGFILGVNPQAHYRYDWFTLRSGDVLLLYTDGLSEALNFQDEAFGTERIERALRDAVGQGFSAEGIAKHVVWSMRKFAGLQTRLDDVTLVVVRKL